mmetsp:Transcript_33447/g.96112  ORF Transcript_33447/g.96112 Transcript_33447/m.96112 type:complete len:357 (-) Transcript_33447:132-1202(-)
MQRVEAKLHETPRHQCVQVRHGHLEVELGAGAADQHLGAAAHVCVQFCLQLHEADTSLALQLQQDVAGPEHLLLAQHAIDDEHACGIREGREHVLLVLLLQANPDQLIEGLEEKGRHACASGHWHPLPEELEGVPHAVQGQEEGACRALLTRGVQRDGLAVLVQHGGAARATARARSRPRVEGVLVVVDRAELRHVTVNSSDGSRQDLQLLARIVAHNADLGAHPQGLRVQQNLGAAREPELGGVVAEEAEVVHWVSIQHLHLKLLVAVKDRNGTDGANAGDVSVGEDEAPRPVHHEAGPLGGGRRILLEAPRAGHPQRHDGGLQRGDDLGPLTAASARGRDAVGDARPLRCRKGR